MSNNAQTGISSAALRYLKLIEQNEENGDANVMALSSDVYNKLNEDNESLMLSFNNPFAEKKQDSSLTNPFKVQFPINEPKRSEDVLMTSYNNPFAENNNNQQECNFLSSSNYPFRPINNILDATDILIDDSDINFRPETDQMSFNYPQGSETSVLVPTNSVKSFDFESSSSQSFSSPPQKRYCFDTKNTLFNKPNAEQIAAFELFFKQPGQSTASESFLKPNEKNQNFTDEIFDMQNFNKSFRTDYSLQESDFEQPSSLSMLGETVCDSESVVETTLKNELNKLNDSSSQESSAESTEENICKEDLATSPKNGIRKVNTFYQAPDYHDTEKIYEFYENLNAIDWQSDDINLDNIMEPSLDYILQRLQYMKPLTTGREDALISFDDDDDYICESINQDINEIEESFDEGKFVCSTPEEPENQDDGRHPLEFGDFNMPINIVNSTNVAQADDNDKTKSFLVNKETENVWSAITHVSCSIPLNEQVEQESSEPQFDITTVFDFTYQNDLIDNQESGLKCLDNDTTRYELMLSILKDCNNPFNQTTAEVQETLKIAENRKAAILVQIEMLIEALVTSAVNQETMIIKLHRIKDWNDCKYESNVLSQKETAIKIKSLSFTNKNTERTFTIVVHLLGEIYKLLGQNITCTKRELYYRDVELMKSQVSVNKAIDEICKLLNVQCWELGVLSTSKGLVAGDLRIVTDEDEIIDYSITTNSVPQKPSGIKSMKSNAEYVLVVEKDTVFTRLIEDNIMDKIGRKIILITAKGYPDINTRVLLKKIEIELQKPIYIIVDADAYGIDIMCTYKFGSLQMVNFSEQLAIPTMEWIGIHPTDIEKLDITRIQLTDADVKKVDELLARPYINDHLKTELEHLKFRGLKAEIESIYHFSVDYLVNDYIPQKIAAIQGPMGDIIRGSECFEENLFA